MLIEHINICSERLVSVPMVTEILDDWSLTLGVQSSKKWILRSIYSAIRKKKKKKKNLKVN